MLAQGGWDSEAGRPRDQRLEIDHWIDARLLPWLVEHMTLMQADELRRQLHALVAGPARAASPTQSGVRRRHDTPDTVTLPAAGRSIVAWSDRSLVSELYRHLPAEIRVVQVDDAIDLRLALFGAGTCVVVLDARHAKLGPDEMDCLDGQRVLSWGAPLDVRDVEVERLVDCAAEATPADVASLCARLLG